MGQQARARVTRIAPFFAQLAAGAPPHPPPHHQPPWPCPPPGARGAWDSAAPELGRALAATGHQDLGGATWRGGVKLDQPARHPAGSGGAAGGEMQKWPLPSGEGGSATRVAGRAEQSLPPLPHPQTLGYEGGPWRGMRAQDLHAVRPRRRSARPTPRGEIPGARRPKRPRAGVTGEGAGPHSAPLQGVQRAVRDPKNPLFCLNSVICDREYCGLGRLGCSSGHRAFTGARSPKLRGSVAPAAGVPRPSQTPTLPSPSPALRT